MNKIIVVFGILLALIAGIAFYQYNVSKKSQPQMKTTGKATIGSHTFNIEVVKDSKAQQIGLTKYSGLQENQGMLFIFPNPGMYGFWMRGMKFPIDMIFINNNKVVSTNENLQPIKTDAKNISIYEPAAPADNVLEIKAGLVKKYNIKKGDTVKIQ